MWRFPLCFDCTGKSPASGSAGELLPRSQLARVEHSDDVMCQLGSASGALRLFTEKTEEMLLLALFKEIFNILWWSQK